MASELHVLFILGKLEKFWKSDQYVDCIIQATDGETKCHRMILSSVSKSLEMQKTMSEDSKKCMLRVKANLEEVSNFLNLLYKPTPTSSDNYGIGLTKTAQLFGMNIYSDSKLKAIVKSPIIALADKFYKQRNENFSAKLAEIHKNKSTFDITLLVDKQKFYCHKVIMASFSSYFDAMFTTDLREVNQAEVEIHFVDKKTFKQILEYIYTGINIINMSNFEQVLSASSYLQIPLLQSKCERFIARHIDYDNCIDVAKLGDTFGSEYLISKAVSFICSHFDKVASTNEFLTIPESLIIKILQSDEINAEDEYHVLQPFLQWLQKQKEDEIQLTELIKMIRLQFVLDSELLETLQNPNISKNQECVQYINKIMKNKYCGSRHNRSFKTEETMVVMWSSSYQPGVHLACFSFASNLWYQLPSLPKHNTGCSYGACSDDSHIYVCGGSGSPRAFHQFNFGSNEWRSLGPMEQKFGRADHAVVIKNENLYIIGGSPDQIVVWPHVDRYNVKNRTYDRIGSLSIAVMNPTCAVFDDSIIVFGGNKSLGEYVSSIQRFDLSTNSCTVFSKLPIMCSYSGIAMSEEGAYIVGPRGDVVLYEYGNDPVVIGSVCKQTIFGFGTVFYKGNVYVLGGRSDRVEFLEARSFDVATRTNTKVNQNMKIPAKKESNQYFVTIHNIRKSLLQPSNILNPSIADAIFTLETMGKSSV